MPNWSSGNIFAKCEQVFRPEGSKYCRFCKCYVPNDTPSWQQHTQGSGHSKAKSEHLRKLGREVSAKKNEEKNKEEMLHHMEEQALEDYKEKDISESRDFTAKLYNNEPLPGTEQYIDKPEPPRKKRGAIAKKGEEEVQLTWAQKYMAKMQEGKVSGGLRKVEAPQGGTRWHKGAGDSGKVWCEAKNEDGSRYYYHSQTHETRWEPPSGGFLSIKEQRELRGEKEEVVQAGSDEEEDEEEKEEREKQALLAAHQAKKQQVEQSEAHRLVNKKLQEAPVPLHGVKPKEQEPAIIAKPKIVFRKRDIMEVPKE